MKKLLILLGALFALLPVPVSAGTSANVVITATGVVIAAPGGFTLTYITDYEVGIDWTKAPGAVNTMVRAAVGRYPSSTTDGYLVYYGNGTSATDTGVSLDETPAAVYYRAWSENVNGIFSPVWAEGTMEGAGMMLLFLGLMALVPTIACYALRRSSIAIIGVLFWIIMGVYAYTKIGVDGDVYWAIFFGSIFMGFMTALEPFFTREKKEEIELDEREKSYQERAERRQKKENRIKQMFGKSMSNERISEIKRRNEMNRVANRNEAIYRQTKGY